MVIKFWWIVVASSASTSPQALGKTKRTLLIRLTISKTTIYIHFSKIDCTFFQWTLTTYQYNNVPSLYYYCHHISISRSAISIFENIVGNLMHGNIFDISCSGISYTDAKAISSEKCEIRMWKKSFGNAVCVARAWENFRTWWYIYIRIYIYIYTPKKTKYHQKSFWRRVESFNDFDFAEYTVYTHTLLSCFPKRARTEEIGVLRIGYIFGCPQRLNSFRDSLSLLGGV